MKKKKKGREKQKVQTIKKGQDKNPAPCKIQYPMKNRGKDNSEILKSKQ